MRALLLFLGLLFAEPALAQNITCPTRPVGDSSRACANTEFVQDAIDNITPSSIDLAATTSTATSTCTATAGSNTLSSCSDTSTFEVGQEVLMFNVGDAYASAAPSGLAGYVCGNPNLTWCPVSPGKGTSTTSYTYAVAPMSRTGAIGAPIASVTIPNAHDTLMARSVNELEYTPNSPAADAYVILKGSPATTVVGLNWPTVSGSVVSWFDYGRDNIPLSVQPWLPSTITAARPGWLRRKVASKTQSSITFAGNAATATATGTVYHVNDDAIIQSFATQNTVELPCGTYNVSGERILLSGGTHRSLRGNKCVTFSVIGGVLYQGLFRVQEPFFTFNGVNVDNHLIPQAKTGLISCTGCDDLTIKDVELLNVNYHAVSIFGSNRLHIDNLHCTTTNPVLTLQECINASAANGFENDNTLINRVHAEGLGIFAWLGPGSIIMDSEIHDFCFGAGLGSGSSPFSSDTIYLNNHIYRSCPGTVGATFNGTIVGTTLTATGVVGYLESTDQTAVSGPTIHHDSVLLTGASAGTRVTAQLTGTPGKDGTYTVSKSQTAGPVAMTAAVATDSNDTALGCIESWGLRMVIMNNKLHNCYENGLRHGGQNGIIVNNTGFDNGVGGVFIHYATSVYNANGSLVTGNKFFDSGAGVQAYGYYAPSTQTAGVTEYGNVWGGYIAKSLRTRDSQWFGSNVVLTSTAFTNVTTMAKNVEAGKRYHIRARYGVIADTTGGFKTGFNGTATITGGDWNTFIYCNTSGAFGTVDHKSAFLSYTQLASCQDQTAYIEGTFIVTGDGTIYPVFAQVATSGSTTVNANSYFLMEELNY